MTKFWKTRSERVSKCWSVLPVSEVEYRTSFTYLHPCNLHSPHGAWSQIRKLVRLDLADAELQCCPANTEKIAS